MNCFYLGLIILFLIGFDPKPSFALYDNWWLYVSKTKECVHAPQSMTPYQIAEDNPKCKVTEERGVYYLDCTKAPGLGLNAIYAKSQAGCLEIKKAFREIDKKEK